MQWHIDIAIEGGQWPTEAQIRPLIGRALSVAGNRLGLGRHGAEVSIVLTDDPTMAGLNARWRGKDAPTNVLSFPAYPIAAGEPPGPLLGDIVLARETIVREAAIDGKAFDSHFSHLIVHGFLHLLGYDHQIDEDAEQMERLERAILAELGIRDPYAPVLDDPKADGRTTT